MKPLPDCDPARAKLASAIALHAGARRDLQTAEQAASLAAERCWSAQAKVDELRNEPPAPSGALADAFTASIASGNPCNVATLERSSVAVGAQMTAAESDARVWKQTHEECDLAVRAKEAEVATAKERVARAARVVVAGSETVTRLMDGLEVMQTEIIEKRVILRFIWSKGINGELSAPDMDRMERLLRQDLTGWESHPVHGVWRAAFDALITDFDVELPNER